MTRSDQYTEDQLVEQPAIKLFEELGRATVNAYHETLGPEGTLGRDTRSEVFLIRRQVIGDFQHGVQILPSPIVIAVTGAAAEQMPGVLVLA